MAKRGTVIVRGASGAQYLFEYFDFPGEWPEFPVVYIVGRDVRQPIGIEWIYVGQTDNLQERFENHEKQACFESHHADVLCYVRIPSEDRRRWIEADLLEVGKPPCNDSAGLGDLSPG